MNNIKEVRFYTPFPEERYSRDPGADYRIGGVSESITLHIRKIFSAREVENPDEVPPLLHEPDRHVGSDARYLFDAYKGNDRVLLSFMAPGSQTSKHFHPDGLIEEYYVLAGTLYLNGVVVPQEGISVLSREMHQASTVGSHALTLIIMRNARKYPEELQHIK